MPNSAWNFQATHRLAAQAARKNAPSEHMTVIAFCFPFGKRTSPPRFQTLTRAAAHMRRSPHKNWLSTGGHRITGRQRHAASRFVALGTRRVYSSVIKTSFFLYPLPYGPYSTESLSPRRDGPHISNHPGSVWSNFPLACI